jgi:hypothetical protein
LISQKHQGQKSRKSAPGGHVSGLTRRENTSKTYLVATFPAQADEIRKLIHKNHPKLGWKHEKPFRGRWLKGYLGHYPLYLQKLSFSGPSLPNCI